MSCSRRAFLRFVASSPLFAGMPPISRAVFQQPEDFVISDPAQAINVFDFEALSLWVHVPFASVDLTCGEFRRSVRPVWKRWKRISPPKVVPWEGVEASSHSFRVLQVCPFCARRRRVRKLAGGRARFLCAYPRIANSTKSAPRQGCEESATPFQGAAVLGFRQPGVALAPARLTPG